MLGLQACTALEELYLSHNGIWRLEGLASLGRLRVLDVSNNRISVVEVRGAGRAARGAARPLPGRCRSRALLPAGPAAAARAARQPRPPPPPPPCCRRRRAWSLSRSWRTCG
jgi:hypothetical protein